MMQRVLLDVSLSTAMLLLHEFQQSKMLWLYLPVKPNMQQLHLGRVKQFG
jgi:hypothetical protein